ncbi:MAG: FAD:protein FMN transferase [Actinomycetota bacterium]|nr:MAG: FAD:protein FMN transferase [Actinomycetota bacterium]
MVQLEHRVPSVKARPTPMTDSFRAMATSVIVSAYPTGDGQDFQQSFLQIKAVFTETEVACTRFNPNSDLSQLNQSPESWHEVSPVCFMAIQDAYEAYKFTDSIFDPRILADLLSLGYRNSWTAGLPDTKSDRTLRMRNPLPEWKPEFKGENLVRVGELPIDLGGIGKGLALRWSAAAIRPAQSHFLIEAGGDCICSGNGPTTNGWNIGVQNPFQPEGDPMMVLRLSDLAVCTSSTAVRSWWQNGQLKHHLIDPRTGEPGGKGLSAVTVIAKDPAEAEIWAKVLFLVGRDHIRLVSETNNIPAVWITDYGEALTNSLISPFVIWKGTVV